MSSGSVRGPRTAWPMQSQQVRRASRQMPWEPPDPDVRTRAYRCSAVRRPIGSLCPSRRAVGLDVGGVDGTLVGNGARAGQALEQASPQTLVRPPVGAVVDGGARPVGCGAVAPAAAGLEHVENA